MIGELRKSFDWVICDSPAGIERGALLAMRFADTGGRRRQSGSLVGARLRPHHRPARFAHRPRRGRPRIDKHLLLTRFDPARSARGEMLSVADVLEILSIPLLGIIPESEEILRASNVGAPITMNAGASAAARAYKDAARRLCRRNAADRDPERQETFLQPPVRPEGCMNLFKVFQARGSAPVARERLQILLAHERVALGPQDLIARLRDDLIATISRHVEIDPAKVMVKMDSDLAVSTLEIDIEIPREKIVGDGRRRPLGEAHAA